MTARIDSSGTVITLASQAGLDEVVSAEDVKDPAKLAQILTRILKAQSEIRRRQQPRWIDFEDVAVTNAGTVLYRFEHGFGGRVRWWPVNWTSALNDWLYLVEDSTTDENTLVLRSFSGGTVTVRIQEEA